MFCFSGLPVGDDVEDLLDLGFDCIVAIESSTQARVSAFVIPFPAEEVGHSTYCFQSSSSLLSWAALASARAFSAAF